GETRERPATDTTVGATQPGPAGAGPGDASPVSYHVPALPRRRPDADARRAPGRRRRERPQAQLRARPVPALPAQCHIQRADAAGAGLDKATIAATLSVLPRMVTEYLSDDTARRTRTGARGLCDLGSRRRRRTQTGLCCADPPRGTSPASYDEYPGTLVGQT